MTRGQQIRRRSSMATGRPSKTSVAIQLPGGLGGRKALSITGSPHGEILTAPMPPAGLRGRRADAQVRFR